LVDFKIDTGAAVTAIPSNLIGLLPELSATNKTLRGAGDHKLKIVGKASVKLTFRDRMITETIYVIYGLVNPFLGKPAISGLGVIGFMNELHVIDNWPSQFPGLFKGLGSIGSDVKIKLKADVAPFAQMAPRRVPAARRAPLMRELKRMEGMGVISKIDEPTDWCSPCVVVPKKDGRIRLCVDYTKLNAAVKRECHPLPTTEETLGMLGRASYFSKLDANSGYWQMRIHDESKTLTTFITPFGRYMCNRLPFGISSAPEIFQKEMQRILMDLPGVVCQMDDILVFGTTQREHDGYLKKVLDRLLESGLTLNPDKCEFNRREVKFLGHIIDQSGIKADPAKTKAIVEFAAPSNKKELRRFFGMVNYLGKFTPMLAEGSQCLRQLLSKDNDWVWDVAQQKEFERLKHIMASTPTLAPFRVDAPTTLSTDASSYGLGAAVLQRSSEGSAWRPVAYASRTLTQAEQNYAQIEKEALAICWGCEKFDYYLAGREFMVETDHKPLTSILGQKELARLPIRVQRFRLRMMAYSYKVKYTPGEKLVLADALSRAPVDTDSFESVVGELVGSGTGLALMETIPISAKRLERIKAAICEDTESLMLRRAIMEGWPCPKKVPPELRTFYTFRDFLTCIEGVIFYMDRVYIPRLERERVLDEIHLGHQGEVKCIRRGIQVVWWPGLTRDIRDVVRKCSTCEEFRRKPREPMQASPFPERPWWRLAMDLCEKDGNKFLVVVDYFSRFITVHELGDNTTSSAVIAHLERLFCLIGIPNSIVCDNGKQLISEQLQKFLARWDICQVTSSPRYPQSNGEAERAVQTVKGLMSKSLNLQAALCVYRDTPLANGYSPAQLLFGRSLNSLGVHKDTRVDLGRLRATESSARQYQAKTYNSRHRVQTQPELATNQPVLVRDPGRMPRSGHVVATSGREAVVLTQSQSMLRRNRALLSRREEPTSAPAEVAFPLASSPHLATSSTELPAVPTPARGTFRSTGRKSTSPVAVATSTHNITTQVASPDTAVTKTRSGRVSRKPNRLNL
jgi:transposase InsO family protein